MDIRAGAFMVYHYILVYLFIRSQRKKKHLSESLNGNLVPISIVCVFTNILNARVFNNVIIIVVYTPAVSLDYRLLNGYQGNIHVDGPE